MLLIAPPSTDDIWAATAIRELCNERDTCNMSDVHAHQTKQIIDRLCIDEFCLLYCHV